MSRAIPLTPSGPFGVYYRVPLPYLPYNKRGVCLYTLHVLFLLQSSKGLLGLVFTLCVTDTGNFVTYNAQQMHLELSLPFPLSYAPICMMIYPSHTTTCAHNLRQKLP
jgi:hypothetical protein